MWGVIPIQDGTIGQPIKNIQELPPSTNLFRGMTTCHSISSIDGEVAGDPLDVKVYKSMHINVLFNLPFA